MRVVKCINTCRTTRANHARTHAHAHERARTQAREQTHTQTRARTHKSESHKPSDESFLHAVVITIEDAVERFLARPSVYLITSATKIPPTAPSSATMRVTASREASELREM